MAYSIRSCSYIMAFRKMVLKLSFVESFFRRITTEFYSFKVSIFEFDPLAAFSSF